MKICSQERTLTRWSFASGLLFQLLTVAITESRAQDFTYTTHNGTITITRYVGQGTVVTIPATINGLPVTGIGHDAFYLTSPTSVTIPNSMTVIGDRAFASCTNLTSLAIPNSVTVIGGDVFDSCHSLTNVILPNGITTISFSLFAGCDNLNSFTIPPGVTNIADSAFYRCSRLTEITIPSGVTSIGTYAFFACEHLENVSLPNGLTTIGDAAFYDCFILTNVAIPDSVTSIGSAFIGCLNLTHVSIPRNVSSIGIGPFSDCTSLTQITVDQLNSFYSSVDGVLFDKSQTTVIQFPGGKTGNYTVPRSVTSIGPGAFNFCFWLVGLFFQSDAPSVDTDSFFADSGLTIYYLPGAKGWGPTFGGVTTKLWNPVMQTSGASFGVKMAQFGFDVTGTANIPLVIEASTNTAIRSWVALQNCTLTNGSIHFNDPQWTNYPSRFYRIRSP